MVNLDNLICSLITNGSVAFGNQMKRALSEQGIEFREGRLYCTKWNYMRFHVGDWIIDDENGKVYYVWGMTNLEHHYMLEEPNGRQTTKSILESGSVRLWTIEDAKVGDVLTDGNIIFIYEGKTPHNSILAECSTENPDRHMINDIKGVKPATREQRDRLFTFIKGEK
jgi:hypothetical protein